MLTTGMLIDNRYKILREIGRGGTSCVYLAENIRIHSYRAVKEVYKSRLSGGGEKHNVFIAESNILTKIKHPGLPVIYDIINTPTSYLIIMEYIEGVSLDKVLEQKGALPQADVIKWGCQLCDVLQYLHTQMPPIIYRDMKPANIMLRPDGNIVLIDFGMAREFKARNSHDTSNLGTHGYAAPEQYSSDNQSDARTDIYSLGVTLYHLVTGHDPCLPPYGINPIRNFNSSLSLNLDAAIKKSTSLLQADRYQSAEQFKNALLQNGNLTFDEPEPSGKNLKWLWSLTAIPVVLVFIIVAVVLSAGNKENYYDGYGYDETTDVYGDDYDYYKAVGLNFKQDVYILEADQREYFTFIPEKSGYFDIYSESGKVRPVIWLTDPDGELVEESNTTGEDEDFQMCCYLVAGEKYSIETTLYDLDPYISATGSYTIFVEYLD